MRRPTHPGSRSTPRPPAAIRVTRRFSAPPERVFHAWLDPEVAGRWLFATATRPMTRVEIDPRVAGAFRFADGRNGDAVEHTGKYVAIVPHRRLVFTLAAGRRRGETRVTVEISPRRTGCELRLTHENLPHDEANGTEARWTGILYGLGVALRSTVRRMQAPRR
jgi:uncharacterized protein YndB with AHSA1/START domain